MDNARIAGNTPEKLVDYAGDIRPVPPLWQPKAPSDADLAQIMKLMFNRTLVDPITGEQFHATEIKDIWRFGWFGTNIGVSVGKNKKVGEYDFDAGLMTPVVAPTSFYTGSDSKEWTHSMRFFILTPTSKDDPVKLPKHIRTWHKEDIPILRGKFDAARAYLKSRIPADVDKDFNIFKFNRHPLVAQGCHRTAALTWQILQQFEHSKGFKAFELDEWLYVAYIEMAYGGGDLSYPVDRDLIVFVANRIKDVVNVDDLGTKGYQDYMLRYVLFCYYLGFPDEAWEAACGISKLRGREFTKSPLYDCVLDLKAEPEKFSTMFLENPLELLTYFRI